MFSCKSTVEIFVRLLSEYVLPLDKILSQKGKIKDISDCKYLLSFPLHMDHSFDVKAKWYIDKSFLFVLLTYFLIFDCYYTISLWGLSRTTWLICFKANLFILEKHSVLTEQDLVSVVKSQQNGETWRPFTERALGLGSINKVVPPHSPSTAPDFSFKKAIKLDRVPCTPPRRVVSGC